MMLITVAEVGSCLLARPDPTPGCGAAASCSRDIPDLRGMKTVASLGAARGLAALESGGTSRQKARGRMMTGGGSWLGSGEVRDPEADLLSSWGRAPDPKADLMTSCRDPEGDLLTSAGMERVCMAVACMGLWANCRPLVEVSSGRVAGPQ